MSFDELLSDLENRLGHTFADRRYVVEALTHSTFANERPGSGPANERLEFLGDAVLGLVTAHLLFMQFPGAAEGELTRHRARLVCTETFAELAENINLSVCLRVGQGPIRDGTPLGKRLLAGAYEALAGAVFLDGGLAEVQRCFGPILVAAMARTERPSDYKTLLQEACHGHAVDGPHYAVVQVEGPDHARVYTCQVTIGDGHTFAGVASSKKTAEQICAKQALAELESK